MKRRITLPEALRLLARDAAFGTFDEKRKATLTPGEWADLEILGRNPLAVHPTQISEIPVLVTMVGGRGECWASRPRAARPRRPRRAPV